MSLGKFKLDAASSKRCNNAYYFINGDNNKESGNEKTCFIIKKWSGINNNSDKIIILVNFAVLYRRQ